MAINFFERQDEAKKKTGRLIVLLVLGMAGIAVTTYVAAVFLLGLMAHKRGVVAADPRMWNAPLFCLIAGGTVLVVLGASFFRTAQLREGGGAGVALAMGGSEISQGATSDADEKKLLNIVEEMSIASGVTMPRVFIMEDEEGINAFAAGWDQNEAVISVTRGAIQRLTRDELQGVIGHEFSHILNGDMRRNIRLMGLVFGLLALAVVGRVLLEIGWYSRGSSSRDDKDKGMDPRLVFALLGLLFIVMGYVGAFFGHLMQAAISRQREFLADASSVQFTRNPEGLAGALKQIGASSAEVSSPRAKEAGHMFFGETSSSLFGFLESHPPLEERIRRLDPAWDGTFPASREVQEDASRVRTEAWRSQGESDGVSAAAMNPAGMGAATIPAFLRSAVHQPPAAVAIACALLLDTQDAGVREAQCAAVTDENLAQAIRRISGAVLGLPDAARLALGESCAPAMRSLALDLKGNAKLQMEAIRAANAGGGSDVETRLLLTFAASLEIA